MQATSIGNRRNLHLLEIQSPHDALRPAQMCDERISVVYLRHHGIVIYMKTPYVARGTSVCDNSSRVDNGIHLGPVRSEKERHPDRLDRGRTKFTPRDKQNKAPS